jgi:hypothetical protein
MKAEDLKGMNGRRVLVEGVLDYDGPSLVGMAYVRFGDGLPLTIPHSAIREILPQEIGVGDRVRHQMWPDVEAATVLALHNGRAWVLHSNGARDDLDQSRLTLIEPAQ